MNYYPKSCYSINETATKNAMAEYDRKRKIWYDAAEKLYPNYWKMSLKERYYIKDKINEYVGFRL